MPAGAVRIVPLGRFDRFDRLTGIKKRDFIVCFEVVFKAIFSLF
jgi:hypothetical protein